MHGVTKHYKNMNSQTYFSLLSAKLHTSYAHKHTAFEKLHLYVIHIHATEAANYVKISFTVP